MRSSLLKTTGLPLAASLLLLAASTTAIAQVTFDTPGLRWDISARGRTTSLLEKSTGRELCASAAPVFCLRTATGGFFPERVRMDRGTLTVDFEQGAGSCRFSVKTGKRCVILRLAALEAKSPWSSLTLCRLQVPFEGKYAGVLNAWRGPEQAVAIMGLAPTVRPGTAAESIGNQASPGVIGKATFSAEARVGQGAARLRADNPTGKPGWSVWHQRLLRPLDLTGHEGLGLWVKGDGSGAALKVQLRDLDNKPADYVTTLNFAGWRYVELPRPTSATLDNGRIVYCHLYYNGLPANRSVECLVDDLRALDELTGRPPTEGAGRLIESFESPALSYYDIRSITLAAECVGEFGAEGAGVGVLACPADALPVAIEELELLGGLPSPHFAGQWNKTSVDVKRSYLSVADLTLAQVDQVIAFAKRCGFGAIMIRGDGAHPWCRSLGHYEINTDNYPRGLPDLKAAVGKIRAAGLRCWLHLLAPSISVHDPHIPDRTLPQVQRGGQPAGQRGPAAAQATTGSSLAGSPGEIAQETWRMEECDDEGAGGSSRVPGAGNMSCPGRLRK